MIVIKKLRVFGIPVFCFETHVDEDLSLSNTSGQFELAPQAEEEDWEEYDEEYNNGFGFRGRR